MGGREARVWGTGFGSRNRRQGGRRLGLGVEVEGSYLKERPGGCPASRIRGTRSARRLYLPRPLGISGRGPRICDLLPPVDGESVAPPTWTGHDAAAARRRLSAPDPALELARAAAKGKHPATGGRRPLRCRGEELQGAREVSLLAQAEGPRRRGGAGSVPVSVPASLPVSVPVSVPVGSRSPGIR